VPGLEIEFEQFAWFPGLAKFLLGEVTAGIALERRRAQPGLDLRPGPHLVLGGEPVHRVAQPHVEPAIPEAGHLKAEAFFKSKAWTDLAPDRDKALKTIRRYGVEALN
jgi:hypothetical protein